ncbi:MULTISPECIES: DUF6890 family protein [Aeromonas]|uniref:DUF6890 family protein n=1 Tax=Aeromonas TaxID=642 RepID=UPI000E9F34F5|nr:hypothetical protein [Aeromonas salmonicida]HAT04155.1 hypothetical protein [Aeromonas salmonicida]HBL04539.1 hypothetical protein [Aeromonas salmonicida]
MTGRAEAIERNQLEQVLALRRHYLPHEEDDLDSLARALWFDKHARDTLAFAVAQGIAKAFNG